MVKGLVGILVIGLMMTGVTSTAQAKDQSETIKGQVVCFGCSLKKEQGAKAQCSVYGHKNAIKMKNGKIWSILENDASAELIKNHEYAGNNVEITGKKLANAQTIEVESFKVLSEDHSNHKH